MQVWKLETDEDIKSAFVDQTVSIFWREGSTGDYENIKVGGYDLETVIDATCHGFEFVALSAALSVNVIDDEEPVESVVVVYCQETVQPILLLTSDVPDCAKGDIISKVISILEEDTIFQLRNSPSSSVSFETAYILLPESFPLVSCNNPGFVNDNAYLSMLFVFAFLENQTIA